MSIRTLIRERKKSPLVVSPDPAKTSAAYFAASGPFVAYLYVHWQNWRLTVQLGKREVTFYLFADSKLLDKFAIHAARVLLAERTPKPVRTRHLPRFKFRKI